MAVVGAGQADLRLGAAAVLERGGPDGVWATASTLRDPERPNMTAVSGETVSCQDGTALDYTCADVDLVAFLPLAELGAAPTSIANDIWGWTDPQTGREYVLLGKSNGTSFVDITDPNAPAYVGELPLTEGGVENLWRDIKTYADHAFIVADNAGAHGVQIFDLTQLRDVRDPPVMFEETAHYDGVFSSHNIVINEETGYAYAVGNSGPRENCGGGLHMIDLSDPRNPEFVGCGPTRRIHDSQCAVYRGPDERYRGRELCLNSSGDAFEISDVTDKTNPVSVASASSPRAAYIHQGWLTPDHRYFYQNDELDVLDGSAETTRTLIWDVADVEDPILVNTFMGSFPASAHNHYPRDGLLYQANYRHGLQVLDVSDPVHPQEVGFFDTAPYQEGPGLSGAWGVYPFFESGTVIVTSMQEGLFVLRKREGPGVAAGSVRRPD